MQLAEQRQACSKHVAARLFPDGINFYQPLWYWLDSISPRKMKPNPYSYGIHSCQAPPPTIGIFEI